MPGGLLPFWGGSGQVGYSACCTTTCVVFAAGGSGARPDGWYCITCRCCTSGRRRATGCWYHALPPTCPPGAPSPERSPQAPPTGTSEGPPGASRAGLRSALRLSGQGGNAAGRETTNGC